MNHPIPFLTRHGARYFLRTPRHDDIQALHALYHHPEVARWLPQCFTSGNIAGTLLILKNFVSLSFPHGMVWAITNEADELIGTCALEAHVPEHARYEIAFELHPSLHRQGIMTAALSVLIDYGFKAQHTNRIDAYILPDNLPSKKLLESLGFRVEGLLKKFRYFRGCYQDVLILGLTHDDWHP